MTNLSWMTDIHLDMVGNLRDRLIQLSEKSRESEAIIITGDISIANLLCEHLLILESYFQKQIYFILGNHDYYGSSISSVRKNVSSLCLSSSYLRYMSNVAFIRLDDSGTYLVGHDGWYDAQNGHPYNDSLLMNDWLQISDFNSALRAAPGGKVLNKNVIMDISRKLAQQSVNHIANGIKSVIKHANHIVIMTHVPPFKESFTTFEHHSGNSTMDILPWYTSKVMGDMIFSAAKTYPHIKFTVLSGHAHSHYDDDFLNNLNVKIGKSTYGNPQITNLTII